MLCLEMQMNYLYLCFINLNKLNYGYIRQKLV